MRNRVRSEAEQALFRPADAGFFTLPAEIVALRAKLAELEALQDQIRREPRPANPRASALQAVLADSTATSLDAALTAESRAESSAHDAEVRPTLLAEAVEHIENRLGAAVSDLADVILAEHLALALAEVVAAVKARVDIATTIPWNDARAVSRASEPVLEAYETVSAAADRYGALRAAQSFLQRLTSEPAREAFDVYGQVKNMRDVWAQQGQGYPPVPPPWPDELPARLVWFVTHGADLWIPTGPECEAHYLEQLPNLRETAAKALTPTVMAAG